MKATVLIDTYNHERFIERAITSVLEQDMPLDDVEILVVDDGSTDRTPELVRCFEPRVRLLRKSNGGQASAFNAGIPECRGEIIAFLDGDDWWLPGKLARVIEVLSREPTLGAVGHGFVEVQESGAEHKVVPTKTHRLRLNSRIAGELFRLCRCYLGTSRLALRSEVARRILPVPEALVFEADEYLFTLAVAMEEAVILPEVLTVYRAHGANLFLASGGSRIGERRKQQVLAALSRELPPALKRLGLSAEASGPVVEMVKLEAAQLRLAFDGGYPWETYHTETALYRILHPGAARRSKAFRALTMIPAMVLPPRWFYRARRWLASQRWYRKTRKTVLPTPAFMYEGEKVEK